MNKDEKKLRAKVARAHQRKNAEVQKQRTRDRVTSTDSYRIMRTELVNGRKVARAELVDMVVAMSGIKDYSVANYIARAKKDPTVLGFKIAEERDEHGDRVLFRVRRKRK